jgi:hypothetical protein
MYSIDRYSGSTCVHVYKYNYIVGNIYVFIYLLMSVWMCVYVYPYIVRAIHV